VDPEEKRVVTVYQDVAETILRRDQKDEAAHRYAARKAFRDAFKKA
jgi:hypothetical protein